MSAGADLADTVSAEEAVTALRRRPHLHAWFEQGAVLVALSANPRRVVGTLPAPGTRVRTCGLRAALEALGEHRGEGAAPRG